MIEHLNRLIDILLKDDSLIRLSMNVDMNINMIMTISSVSSKYREWDRLVNRDTNMIMSRLRLSILKSFI